MTSIDPSIHNGGESSMSTNKQSFYQDNLQISTYAAHSQRTVIQTNQAADPSARQVLIIPETSPVQKQVNTTRPNKRCYICDRSQTNIKKHIATSHLGSAWWGILAEITCWRCCNYHNKESIARCNGLFNQSLHSQILL